MKKVFLTDILGDPDYSVGDISKFPPVDPAILFELCHLSNLASQFGKGYDVHIVGCLHDGWSRPHRWCVEIGNRRFEIDVGDTLPKTQHQLKRMLTRQSGDCEICSNHYLERAEEMEH